MSAVLPPSDLLFLLEDNCKDTWGSVQWIKVSINQWHNYGSVHLAIFDHLWVFEIVSGLNSVERTNREETERAGGRISEKREKGAMITLISSLLTLFLICETAISPKYNFEKLLRKWTISDFCWLKTYRVWCIVLLMANPPKCLDEWTIGTIKVCAHSKKDVWRWNSFRWIK